MDAGIVGPELIKGGKLGGVTEVKVDGEDGIGTGVIQTGKAAIC